MSRGIKNFMVKTLKISEPKRPHIPGYGISEEKEGMVDWDTVNQWMNDSKNYWLGTTRPNYKPHSRPIWGIWLDNFFYFGGGSSTKTVRNLAERNHISVHTESAENAVIIEGYTENFDDEELNKVLGKKYEERYGILRPPPCWRVIPEVVFAWSMEDYSNTPTKFICSLEK